MIESISCLSVIDYLVFYINFNSVFYHAIDIEHARHLFVIDSISKSSTTFNSMVKVIEIHQGRSEKF